MIEFKYFNEFVSSPAIIVSGKTDKVSKGIIKFAHKNINLFPPQCFEINNGYYKALLHLELFKMNEFDVVAYDDGQIELDGDVSHLGKVEDTGFFTVAHNSCKGNKPLHLCVLLGKDSNGVYDMPLYKSNRGEVANLNTAIKRLKVAARMMQAYTHDEFNARKLGNRTFQFVEEETINKSIFGNFFKGEAHSDVKVHVLRSEKTVSELRNLEYAQQFPGADKPKFLFDHCVELIKQHELYTPYEKNKSPIQCAVMIMDSHWDQNYIVAHAAVGGGNRKVRMAIFGSHGLHSFPLAFGHVNGCFVDNTQLSKAEVANDNNKCGTAWRCLNVCMGAFMHEIGHLFGTSHQREGLMLHDYIYWNRSFMTREPSNNDSSSILIGTDGKFPKECHFQENDIVRFLYHGSFSEEQDAWDPDFKKLDISQMKYNEAGEIPTYSVTEKGSALLKSYLGIYMIEFDDGILPRHQIVYYPKRYGGQGLGHNVRLDFENSLELLKSKWKSTIATFGVRLFSAAGEQYIKDYRKVCYPASDEIIRSDFNLGRGTIEGYKSEFLGIEDYENNEDGLHHTGFDVSRVDFFRVFHGNAVDGIQIFMRPVEEGQGEESIMVGSTHKTHTDFHLNGEKLTKVLVRSGSHIDAIQFETETGRQSPLCGTTGGHLTILEPTSSIWTIVGFLTLHRKWFRRFGIICARV